MTATMSLAGARCDAIRANSKRLAMRPREENSESALTVWSIEPGYTTVEFSASRFIFGALTGRFDEVIGTIVFDEGDLRRSSVETAVKATSISAGKRSRDQRLLAADFLAVEQYPEIQFHSSNIARGRDRDTLRVSGTLTIKDKSREIDLDVTLVDRSRSPQGAEVAYYSAKTEIDRRAFSLNYRGGIIGGKLTITIHAQAIRRQ
jgi:polyisoprenoid-binding protein YceI